MFFLLLTFKRSLYTLDTSPLSDKCFPNIFSQFMVHLFILLKVFYKEPKFLIYWTATYNFLLSWIMLLMFSLKVYYQPQSHVDLFLYFLLKVLYFSLLHMVLFWVNVSKGYRSVSRVFFFFFFFFFCRWTPKCPGPFVQRVILSPLNCLWIFDKYQLATFVWVYFWAVYHPLINVSILQ